MNTRKGPNRGLIYAVMGMVAFASAMGGCREAKASSPLREDAPGTDAPADAFACADDTMAAAARAIHFAGSADFWTDRWHNACRIDPEHPDLAIVALTYTPGEQLTGKTYEGDDFHARDLDLVVMRLTDDKVMAHRHEDQFVEDGGDRFESIAIDTGRYTLAPGERAFGVRVHNATHCTCANQSFTTLTLYLRHGDRLDPMASVGVDSSQAGYEMGTETPPPCTSLATGSTTSIKVSKSRSHGLADLHLVSTETPSYDVDEDPSKCPPLTPSKRTTTLRFDGTTYK